MIRLDAATVLLQWAVGGLFFCGSRPGGARCRSGTAGCCAAPTADGGGRASSRGCATARPCRCGTSPAPGWCWRRWLALVVSVQRRSGRGGAASASAVEARSARVDGHDRHRPPARRARDADGRRVPARPRPASRRPSALVGPRGGGHRRRRSRRRCPSPASWSGPPSSAAVTDAMLLGHWYLVQPGMPRGPLLELIRWLAAIWPLRGAGDAVAGRHGVGDHRHDRRRLQRHPRLDVGRLRDQHHRARRRHPRRPQGAAVHAPSWPPPASSTSPSSPPSAPTSSPGPSWPVAGACRQRDDGGRRLPVPSPGRGARRTSIWPTPTWRSSTRVPPSAPLVELVGADADAVLRRTSSTCDSPTPTSVSTSSGQAGGHEHHQVADADAGLDRERARPRGARWRRGRACPRPRSARRASVDVRRRCSGAQRCCPTGPDSGMSTTAVTARARAHEQGREDQEPGSRPRRRPARSRGR